MIHLDTLSKRVLIIALSVSMVLLSLSAFVATISQGGDFSETDHLISEMADRATEATDFTPN